MAMIGSQSDLALDLLENKHSVQVIARPAIPDNDLHQQVIENDEQIVMFMQQSCEFAEQLQPKSAKAYGNQVIQLKSSKLSKGLITL